MPRTPKTIVLTGGGTAGHVMPHLAVIPLLQKRGWQITYIGSGHIEKQIISEHNIPFKTILSGKLRRYFSIQNFFDVFKVFIGFTQALIYLLRNRPQIVFSKGGFVSVPVTVAAWCLRIPVITHESDLTPGLATKIIARFCKKVLCAFEETQTYFSQLRSVHVGLPIREQLFFGNREQGWSFCGFEDKSLPVLLVMGGSLGALRINECLKEALPELVKDFNVIHITGKSKAIDFCHRNYRSYEFISEPLRDIYALTDIVVCRAGANSIFELLALKKPMLLIPLEVGSRGDQVHNAESFLKQGWSRVLREQQLTREVLRAEILALRQNSEAIKQKQAQYPAMKSAEKILAVIEGQIDILNDG